MKVLLLSILFLSSLLAKPSDVSLQLLWKHQFQFAGFYVAKERGYYEQVGLNVDIKEYNSTINIVDDVILGKSTYGIGRSSLLIDKVKGKPVVPFGAIYQHSPIVLISTNPKIKKLIDLKHKKIMITKDAISSASISGMLAHSYGLKNNMLLQKHSFDYHDLLDGTTDAMACYISNEPYYLEKSNIKYKVFDPKEYGFDFYGDIIFTSMQEVQKNPDRVKSFYVASKKGWTWAFNNIEESAKLIYDKYNTQNKSLESLIYEGYALKKLAFVDGIPFGSISKNKFESISRIFKFKGMMDFNDNFDDFLYPFKEKVKIGVLAKRGKEVTHKRWNLLAEYLNNRLDYYDFEIVPLDFVQLEESVKNKSVDFIITNTMYYVLLENRYGISRIATLVNSDILNKYRLIQFGGVIFTKSDSTNINELIDLEDETIGAVSSLSFGGWIMGYEELIKHDKNFKDVKVKFFGTHDAVVNAVLEDKVKVGTVRTDTLERMANEGKIKLSDIKVIAPKKYKNFPYLVSTKLYPEWPIAKLSHTSDELANKLLSEIVNYKANDEDIKNNKILGWTVPLDYSSVHGVLKKLRLPPYENIELRFEDILEEYSIFFYIIVVAVIALISRLIYDWRLNIYLNQYNKRLDSAVRSKTRELTAANKKLKILANQDALTKISNRAHFMKFARKYFEIANRNDESLQVLSLDLDYFKKINDTYGHQTGDCVLKEFTNKVSLLLRKSDIFGRVGGEEFCILLQNTSIKGAENFATRVCEEIENMDITCDKNTINITVSIGVASLKDEKSIEELIKKSDIALYTSKEKGRNQVRIYTQN
ncbi:MAG: diguanylate cyclase [Thiovulaceae bacterium]|nr:diguanylate cyclase [Sulfurimonadaceae bacterium]